MRFPGNGSLQKSTPRPANETAAPECVCFQHKALSVIEFPQLADTPLQVTDTPPLMTCYHDAATAVSESRAATVHHMPCAV